MGRGDKAVGTFIALAAVAVVANLIVWGVVVWAIIQLVQWLTNG